MKTLALYSNKGGVGKTAATVNLSYLAAQAGSKTLVCDLDPQGATTYYFRIKPKLKAGAQGLNKAGKALDKSIKGTDYENLDLLPADFSHRNLDLVFNGLKRSKQRLSKVINPFAKEYDLVVLDCPPTINLLAENIFKVSDLILVPLIPTVLSVRTHLQLLKFLRAQRYNEKRVHAFFSMADRRKKLHRELIDSLPDRFRRVLPQIIPYASDVERMGLERQPLPAFAPDALAARAYRALWHELEHRL